MKKLIASLGLLVLAGCSYRSPEATTVETYLNAVKSGDIQAQQEVYCIKTEATGKNAVKSAPGWNIVGEEKRTSTAPAAGFPYTLVTVKIGDQQQQLEVWKSEDVFKHEGVLMGNLNKLQERNQWSVKEFCVIAPN